MQKNRRNWIWMGVMLFGFAAPMAAAGTQQAAEPKKAVKPKKAEPKKAEPQPVLDPQQEAQLQQDTEAAEKSYRKGDLVSAMALWKKAAEKGYAPAQVRLADMLDVAEDDVEAVKWYERAAGRGNAAGEYGLGVMYLKGEGVKQDLEKARSLILKAANKNCLPAMIWMMDAYKAGAAGLPPDPEQAAAWKVRVAAAIAESNPASAPLPGAEKK